MAKVKLGDYIEKISTKAYEIDDYSNLEPLGVSNVEGITTTNHVKSSDLSKYLYIEENYFAYNPYRINVGSIGLTPKGVRGLVSPAYIVFKTKETLLPEILFDFLKSSDGLQQINKLARGTVRKALRYNDLCEIELVVPPIEKQHEILALKRKSEKYTKQLRREISLQQEIIKKLRQSILQEAIEGKLTQAWREVHSDIEPASVLLKKIKAEKEQLVKEKKIRKQKPLPPISDEKKPFEIPAGWEWCRLGEITNIVRGGSPRPAGDKRFYDGNIPFLKVADLTNDNSMYVQGYVHSIKEAGLKKTRFIKEETLMLTNSGATLGIPKICQFPTAFNDGIAAFVHMNNELYKPYFYYFLKSKTEWFLKEASRGQGQPNLNTDIIGETLATLPSFEEQKEIVKKIEALFKICDELEEQINRAKADSEMLMQAVLREAFEHDESIEEIDDDKKAMTAMSYIIDSIDTKNLGRVKLQKIFYMYSAVNNEHFGFNYKKRHAMGPHDKVRMDTIETKLEKAKWFKKVRTGEGERSRFDYEPLSKKNEYKKFLPQVPNKKDLDRIISLMRPLDLARSEVVATLYAVWREEHTLFEMEVEDVVLIGKAREWHPNKLKYTDDYWKWGMRWLRDNGFIG